ncbi:hypothetical protein BACERE00177_03549 [Bacillus mobilis]|uniref:protein containing cell adhesion domain protein n=3 Tax=Bacillus mobilis TaxID=2026190 RepID=UPI000A302E6D|nr:protein containing cell adhesion domain protein [Bacillus mobilis]SME28678.1 hypothetical protein BACERE00177_03549 [Bacillus mobilis]
MANVGDKINGAEPGWTNVDFKDSSIKYTSMVKQTSFAAGSGSASSFSFTFTGTAVRIITGLFSDGVTKAEIKIDNMVEYANFKGTSGDPHIVYEKNKLPYGTHTITVRSNVSSSTPGTLTLMAIHYAAFANQGDKLAKPELGWQRYKFNEKLNDGTEAIRYYPENIWTRYSNYIFTTSKDVGYIRFKFYGSAIRIISTHFSTTASMARITIDGTSSYYNSRGGSDGDRLSFENSNLPLGIHTVQIDTNSTGELCLSAIDLKDGEYLVPLIKVGEPLLQPEPGWTRYDDTDSKIKYSGTWSASTADDGSYNRTVHYTSTTSNGIVSATFSFYGKSIRLIGLMSPYYKKASIIIDGNILEDINLEATTNGKSILVYEKKDLKEGNHTVTIWGEKINLDAIDINQGGYFTPPVKVGDILKEPELGWKRFDDRDTKISYENPDGGSWKISANSDYYNGTITFKEHVGMPRLKVKFKFKGIQLRILATRFSTTVSKYEEAKILIDGVQYVYNQNGTANQYCTLLFESPVLNQDIHTVEITTGKDPFDFDCIDILGGELFFEPAKVGDVLTQPEPGWKRFDDSHNSITYEGVWRTDTGIKNYNSTLHYKEKDTNTGPASIKFNFYGSKLRIIGLSYYYYDTDAKIIIDGNEETINFNLSGTNAIYQCLLYEKEGLSLGQHTVQIQGVYMTLDAIDIDADGYLPAKVGDILTQPEPGWKRFDDTDSNIKYEGNWIAAQNATGRFNETLHYKNNSHGIDPISIEFHFKGTKLRLITLVNTLYDKNLQITIDNVTETFSSYKDKSEAQVIAYEKTGLLNTTHKVIITGTYANLDALDIDADGYLFTPTQVGDVLKEPESVWKRFDDRDPNILYQGNWIENENITTHYRGTFHNKPSSSGDNSIVRALFDFSGTKLRIIAFMTTGSYDVGTIKIDGEAFNFSYIKGTPTAQCLVFEKLGLEPGVHKVELSGRYINLDAVDIDETGELIPIETKKPKVSLYEKESGKIFVDDFDSINPKWLMSPFTAFNNVAKQGFLRMNHSANKDALLLIDKPQGNVAIQVIADYTPTKEGDQGGLLIYKNEANNIEFLESMKVSDSPDPKEWMAVCKENQWDFYNKTDVTFDYVRSEQLEAHKIGVVLKKGNAEGFTPLDINKIIITTSNLLRLRQLYEKYKVVLKDAAENVISTSFVEVANTGIDIPLPSLEFEGIVEIYDEDGTLVAKRQTTFFGGDMYCMGSSLHISMDTKELDETDPTHLGYMTETERLVKMTLTNDNIGPVSNVKVAIQQYMEKFGYTWAHLSLDGSHYTDELSIETLDAGISKDFWVKIIKDVNYMAFEPIYFNIHLSHE